MVPELFGWTHGETRLNCPRSQGEVSACRSNQHPDRCHQPPEPTLRRQHATSSNRSMSRKTSFIGTPANRRGPPLNPRVEKLPDYALSPQTFFCGGRAFSSQLHQVSRPHGETSFYAAAEARKTAKHPKKTGCGVMRIKKQKRAGFWPTLSFRLNFWWR